MKRIHTHYDNLKVVRNAPDEVIRAAYKTLSQKYHPDRNPGNADAARIMAILNESYSVLSDPIRRNEHDEWIRQAERLRQPEIHEQQKTSPTRPPPNKVEPSFLLQIFAAIKALFIWAFTYVAGLAAVVGIFWALAFAASNFSDKSSPAPGPKPYQESPPVAAVPAKPSWVRPEVAPNGSPWPSKAGYVSGYEKHNKSGLSTVTIDNSKNDSDVFVKLTSIDGEIAYPVRVFYIPAFQTFTVNKVDAGAYDVRYRDLNNGGLSRSEQFTLEEIEMADGIQFSNFTMTLYKVQNGNMTTFALAENEF